MLNANMSTVQTMIGYPVLGGLGGLGLASMNKYYSQSLGLLGILFLQELVLVEVLL